MEMSLFSITASLLRTRTLRLFLEFPQRWCRPSKSVCVWGRVKPLGTVVSSVDTSLLLHFWWNNSPEVASFKDWNRTVVVEWMVQKTLEVKGWWEGGRTRVEAKDLAGCSDSTWVRCFPSGKLTLLAPLTNIYIFLFLFNLYLTHCPQGAS